MCMKSVNLNNSFFEEDLSGVSGNLRFGETKSKIKAIKGSNDNYYISRLYILLNFNAMSSQDEDPYLTNVYDIMWTFGCVNSNNIFDNKKISETIIDTKCNKIKNSIVSERAFTNQIRILELKDFAIEDQGKYYLKTYIKKNGTNDGWQIQSITAIDIEF